jgi:hypothetical protein|nr:MAG TPA: hypothetical protein [Caudoviricetes sp.]
MHGEDIVQLTDNQSVSRKSFEPKGSCGSESRSEYN